MAPLTTQLQHAALMLGKRLHELEQQIRQGNESAWAEYAHIAQALASVNSRQEHQAEFLSTREMAERLGVSPKTLLRRKRRGELVPAIQAGKLIRWRPGDTPTALSARLRPDAATHPGPSKQKLGSSG
jgi:DNA-binding transcriptional MerR regulator